MNLSRFFVTADHHFAHANIIKYCDRPYISVGEMDTDLIIRWNQAVGKDDTVWHLGDFTLSGLTKAKSYFARLNGDIRMLSYPWHHDNWWLDSYEKKPEPILSASGHPVRLLPPMVVLEIPELGKDGYPLAITLCHYPLAVWDRKHYGAWHLHGHSHGSYRAEGYIIDVGVDCMGFYPIALSTVVTLMHDLGWKQE
jgi:calcineurin-like phosphoesterase family protein